MDVIANEFRALAASKFTVPAQVRKRDGTTLQDFDFGKIREAVRAAWLTTGLTLDETKLMGVVTFVGASLHGDVADVEQIQDAVEVALMKYDLYAVAKAYIVYRQKRTTLRETRLTPDPLAVSDYIHASKYARYIPELMRREVYLETIDRDEAMHLKRFEHLPELQKLIRWAFDRVREKRVLPSMRSMQFGGAAIEQNNCRIYNCTFTFVDRVEAFSQALFLLLSGCGVGYSVQFDHVEKLPKLSRVNPKQVVHHIIEDSIEGWADALKALLDSYVDGYHVEFSYHLIRSAGAPLKTSGGKAPGHMKLKEALENIRELLHAAQGRKLRPVECHRIMCHAADAVLSGGIRRSAMICLFSLEDSEMVYLKTGNWHDKEPWLKNANNSVLLKRSEVKKKQFKRIFQMVKEWGEPGFFFTEDTDYGTNPCQPGMATVLTPVGIRTFDDVDVGSTIWSGKQWTRVMRKIATGTKPVFAYETRAGVFYGTEEHRIVCEGDKVPVGEATAIDVACGGAEGVESFDVQTVMDGLVLGDGGVHHASNDLVHLYIGRDDQDYHTSEIHPLITRHRPGLKDTAWEIQTTITAEELPATYDRCIPSRFRFGNETTVRSFLRGLYTANGSVVGTRVTLKASSFAVIQQVQEMLSSLGIVSYYTTNKAHPVTFSNGEYMCKESYDLNTVNRTAFQRLIGFIQVDKNRRLQQVSDNTGASAKGTKRTYEIVARRELGEMPVFDITVEADEHTYWTGGLLVSNCGEIGLNPKLVMNDNVRALVEAKLGKFAADALPNDTALTGWAFCNLCEINAAKFKTLKDFEEAAHAATIIGTCQASYTSFPYLGWVSEVIAQREALLGIGMTGMMDAPQIALNPEHQTYIATKIKEWNAEIAAMIGIRPAARTTCVKPSGTTSLELGCVASGHHAHHARRYIRRVTADELETMFQVFKNANPHACVRKPDGKWTIEFPVQAPDGAIVKDDLAAIEFLDMIRSTQKHWVLAGTARTDISPNLAHNVSNTVQVKPDEWDKVAEYIWTHRQDFTGITLLSATGDKDFAFCPNEAVTTEADEARWNQLVSNYTPVDYTSVCEDEDGTNLTGELSCANGACEVHF